MTLPPYASLGLIKERLQLIFPEGTPNRLYCTRDLAASTVFTALYIGAVEGSERYLGPVHVYRMTDEQSAQCDQTGRQNYSKAALQKKSAIPGIRWYADNTREPIRDETLRDGLVLVGAVISRTDVATTSPLPRYALKADFARLFDPALAGPELERAIVTYQESHLSKSALARVAIIRAGAAGNHSSVDVRFPSGAVRQLSPGPSSFIAKAVIESFIPRFLGQAAVLWLSESGDKVVIQDQILASRLGLTIEPDKNLPDLILADLAPQEPLIVFVELVATDGAISTRRQQALLHLAEAAGYKRSQVAFVTAYRDRESSGFRKTAGTLAWDSFAWFASEPDCLLIMRDGTATRATLADLIS